MAYIRRLPSGKFQATVRKPDGKRTTKTARLRSAVEKWAKDLEAKYEAGDLRDPKSGKVLVSSWRERALGPAPAKGAATGKSITRAKKDSLWRTHCEKRWGDSPLDSIRRVDAQAWVWQLEETRKARHRGRPAEAFDDPDEIPYLKASTIHSIVHQMGGLYRAAMKEDPPLVNANPFAELDLPPIDPAEVEFYEREEAHALYEALERLHGPAWRTLAELGMDVGLRPGEIYGLHGHRVAWMRNQLSVVEVMTRHGIRGYPKSMKSHRTVPVPPHVIEGMSRLMTGRPRDALVFTVESTGGPVSDFYMRDVIWYPAVEAARLCGNRSAEEAGEGDLVAPRRCGAFCDDTTHKIRKRPPRIMRHTAASWLVQDEVPLYDVQALLGHEKFTTTERYAHLQPDAHKKVRESWARRTGS